MTEVKDSAVPDFMRPVVADEPPVSARVVAEEAVLALNASMLGRYSIQTNSTSTPASLKKPFWIATSQAIQPGQSE